ncbi:MAG: hypothetical protein JNL36_10825 [Candidatus Kapabacteria bacterium]|nr:hypothetical protein [Candidatus Kapabacteria bacterium]
MYLQTRVVEQYIIIGGVLLCFTPLFFYSVTPFVVPIVCCIIAWITFGISPNYIRFSSQFETITLLSILTVATFIAVVDPVQTVRLPIDVYLYYISLELILRTLLFEFMKRKGFRNVIPLIFVQVLYCCFAITYFLEHFDITVIPLIILGISVLFSSVLLLKRCTLWWQLVLSILISYSLYSYEFHSLLNTVILFFVV